MTIQELEQEIDKEKFKTEIIENFLYIDFKDEKADTLAMWIEEGKYYLAYFKYLRIDGLETSREWTDNGYDAIKLFDKSYARILIERENLK